MVELYEHQRLALSRLKNGSILTGDVGSGKSLVAVAYYARSEAPRNVVVITTAKKRDSLDWEAEFIRYGVGTRDSATTAGVLTVDSWNNLPNYRDLRDCFFIFDEQRVVGSGEWTKNFLRIASQNSWILLSATPGDNWLDYIPVFIANGFYKNRTEFLRNHVVFTRYAKFPKVERYTSVGRLVKLRNDILVPMPFVRGTTRNVTTVLVDHDRERFVKVLEERWNVYEARPLRDVAELFRVMRKVVNTDSSRAQTVISLMETHPRMIVFYNFDYELETLRTVVEQTQTPASTESSKDSTVQSVFAQAATLPSVRNGLRRITGTTTKPTTTGSGSASAPARTEWKTSRSKSLASSSRSVSENPLPTGSGNGSEPVTIAEWNGHKHEEVPSSDRWVYLVQYQAGAEGWNCITTDTMVFYSLTYSYKNWRQAFGRIDRLNTPFTVLNYYVFMSNSVIDKAIWKALEGKKSFNERSFLSRIKDTPSQKSVFRS